MNTYFSIDKAAERAGLSTRHFRRFIESGEIRMIMIGDRRKQFVLAADLEAWIRARQLRTHV